MMIYWQKIDSFLIYNNKKEVDIMKSMHRILIVDDDQAILDMLKLQLEWENYLVDTAVNGKDLFWKTLSFL